MTVELTNNVVVPCPDKGFAMRRAKNCLSCEHYGGVAVASVSGVPVANPGVADMQVICKRPITRRLTEIVDD